MHPAIATKKPRLQKNQRRGKEKDKMRCPTFITVKRCHRSEGTSWGLFQVWAISQPLFYTLFKKILNTDPLEASGLSLIKRKYIA